MRDVDDSRSLLGDANMKLVTSIVTLAALLGSASVFAQMPPPPPGAEGMRMDGPAVERREMRRIVVRGDEQGLRGGMGRFGGGCCESGMRAYGFDPRMVERMATTLDLTPQQQGKMTELVAAARPEMRKAMRELSVESRRLRNLSAGDPKFATESAASARKIGELTTSLAQQSADLRGKLYQVLTPEQRKKAGEMRERMRDRVDQRMKNRPRVFLFEGSNDAG